MEKITTQTAADFDRELRLEFARKNVSAARRFAHLVGGPAAEASLAAAAASLKALERERFAAMHAENARCGRKPISVFVSL